MIFPYADDAPHEGRIPWLNWLLIAANCYFFFTLGTAPDYEQTVARYGFTPTIFDPATLITSLFLHGDLMHLIGNMWFLHLFGDNVENRCGAFKYMIAYLLCGIAGSLSHYFFFSGSNIPSIGASGCIYGVMGMYLFFFPSNRIRVFYFLLILIGTTTVRAIWVIGGFFALEVLSSRAAVRGGPQSGVAHLAHAGGFAGGFFIAAAYLQMGLVKAGREHLWSFFGWRRDAADSGQYPDQQAYRGLRDVDQRRLSQEDPRYEIVALLHARRFDDALSAWENFVARDPEAVLPVREQLQLADALAEFGETRLAQDAYERLLRAYADDREYRPDAALGLATLLLAEYRRNGSEHLRQRIEQLLEYAAQAHPSLARAEQARVWLSALRNGLIGS